MSLYEGYWSPSYVPTPSDFHHPILVGKMKHINQFLHENYDLLIRYHRASKYINLPTLKIDGNMYLDYPNCHVCQKTDTIELHDVIIRHGEKTIVFPSNYYHYLEKHGVTPSTVLIESIMSLQSSDYTITPISDELDHQLQQLEFSEGMKDLKYSMT